MQASLPLLLIRLALLPLKLLLELKFLLELFHIKIWCYDCLIIEELFLVVREHLGIETFQQNRQKKVDQHVSSKK